MNAPSFYGIHPQHRPRCPPVSSEAGRRLPSDPQRTWAAPREATHRTHGIRREPDLSVASGSGGPDQQIPDYRVGQSGYNGRNVTMRFNHPYPLEITHPKNTKPPRE